MKYATITILVVFAVLSAHTLAQEAYVEKIYIFTQDFSTVELAEEECAAGVAELAAKFNVHYIDISSTVKVRINSLQTRDKSGKVVDYQVGDIGSFLTCQGVHDESNQVPLYYEITIGKVKFLVTGAGSSPVVNERVC